MQARRNEARDAGPQAPLPNVPIVPQPVARFDGHEVEPKREPGQRGAIRQRAYIADDERRLPDPRHLAMVDGLLGQAEITARPPPDLNDDQRCRRAWLDADQIQLRAADMDVAAEEFPPGRGELRGNHLLGRSSQTLSRGTPRWAGGWVHSLRMDVATARRLTRSDPLPEPSPMDRSARVGAPRVERSGREERRLRGVEVEAPGQPDEGPVVREIG